VQTRYHLFHSVFVGDVNHSTLIEFELIDFCGCVRINIIAHELYLEYSDDRTLFVVGTLAVHESMFIGFNLLLFLFHHFNLFERYKIQKNRFPAERLVKVFESPCCLR